LTSRRKKITKKNTRTILPEAVYTFMVSGSTRLWGIFLIVLSLLAFAAMAGYNSNDPSWRVAGQEEVKNWLGPAGAWVADVLIQSLGLAAAVLAFPFITWGWRIMMLRGLPKLWRNLVTWVVGVLLASLFAAFLPVADFWADSWQIQNFTMGGIMGDRMFFFLKQLLSDAGIGFYPLITAVFFWGPSC